MLFVFSVLNLIVYIQAGGIIRIRDFCSLESDVKENALEWPVGFDRCVIEKSNEEDPSVLKTKYFYFSESNEILLEANGDESSTDPNNATRSFMVFYSNGLHYVTAPRACIKYLNFKLLLTFHELLQKIDAMQESCIRDSFQIYESAVRELDNEWEENQKDEYMRKIAEELNARNNACIEKRNSERENALTYLYDELDEIQKQKENAT